MVSSFLTATWGVEGTHNSMEGMGEFQRSYMTCSRSPAQAGKGFSCQMGQTSFCSCTPGTFSAAPTCEVQVMYSPVLRMGTDQVYPLETE